MDWVAVFVNYDVPSCICLVMMLGISW